MKQSDWPEVIIMVRIYFCITQCRCNRVVIADSRTKEDYDTLLLTVEALKAQLEEQTRLCKEQVSTKGIDYHKVTFYA